jgi:hypothetical protein
MSARIARLQVLAFAVVVALAGCQRGGDVRSAGGPAGRVGDIFTSAAGKTLATGIVARFPVQGPGGIGYVWALYGDLGSASRLPHPMVALETSPEARGSTGSGGAFAHFEGRAVTVRGRLKPRGFRIDLPRLSADSVHLSANHPSFFTSMTVVKQGAWYDQQPMWRLSLLGNETPPSSSLAAAQAQLPFRAVAPKSALAGRLVAIFVRPPDGALRDRGLDLMYERDVEFDVSRPKQKEPVYDKAWLGRLEGPGSTGKALLVDIAGRKGALVYHFGRGVYYPGAVLWNDGDLSCTVNYFGDQRPVSPPLTERELVEIARSVYQ